MQARLWEFHALKRVGANLFDVIDILRFACTLYCLALCIPFGTQVSGREQPVAFSTFRSRVEGTGHVWRHLWEEEDSCWCVPCSLQPCRRFFRNFRLRYCIPTLHRSLSTELDRVLVCFGSERTMEAGSAALKHSSLRACRTAAREQEAHRQVNS